MINQESRQLILKRLKQLSTPEKATSAKRYFPNGIHCSGLNAADIKLIIRDFQDEHSAFTPDEFLSLTEYLLKNANYSEEIMIAFGLLNKFVKKQFDESLLKRFEFWLESYASNWAHVDDLCLKTIFPFLMARPHLIETTQRWIYSTSPWCRRAGNVVWVKFIQRKIGKQVYCLNTDLVFANCDELLNDSDEFVQKSVGWLLKVTSIHHEQLVIEYLLKNKANMQRATLRYAIEKLSVEKRQALM